ncbi:helix-turn-helix domain-containing protein [Rhizorhabdus histidinilytica]|jgi:transcriptional regulator with XRE-family HTH domain|uniref:helix-turn-helix domain-containing protein n=1 Tax=Rhizorhabdus histidinilytica TaxID=439228 RepID=UPI001F269D95|nr:helix-turn-helix transcriptional regulator [Rhizorhabdus histidinilytica]
MARAALGWSIDKLAEAADMRAATISSFERGGECYRSTVEKVQASLEAAGIVFVNDGEASLGGGAGVRLRE